MQISIVNHSNGRVSDEHLQCVIRAINRQIREDFAPSWGMSATLRLEGRSSTQPTKIRFPDLRGDAVIYIWNEVDADEAFGYHEQSAQGIPYGFVFTEISQSIDEPWSVTLSHEALELIGDPETNLLVMGPHPSARHNVFHWFEMCDAVQDEKYEIDGIAVSNFVLPLYFTGTRRTDEKGARNDFLGRIYIDEPLESFGINPGGYIGFYDPLSGKHEQFSMRGDTRSMKRMQSKNLAKFTRRAIRYRKFADRERPRFAIGNGRPDSSTRVELRAAARADAPITASGKRVYAKIALPSVAHAAPKSRKRATASVRKRSSSEKSTGHKKSKRTKNG